MGYVSGSTGRPVQAVLFDTFGTVVDWRTAFIPRPTQHGPGQTQDLTADGDWDLVCTSIIDLADRFGGGEVD